MHSLEEPQHWNFQRAECVQQVQQNAGPTSFYQRESHRGKPQLFPSAKKDLKDKGGRDPALSEASLLPLALASLCLSSSHGFTSLSLEQVLKPR